MHRGYHILSWGVTFKGEGRRCTKVQRSEQQGSGGERKLFTKAEDETLLGEQLEKEVRRLEPNPRDPDKHKKLEGCIFCKRWDLKKRLKLKYNLVSKLESTQLESGRPKQCSTPSQK